MKPIMGFCAVIVVLWTAAMFALRDKLNELPVTQTKAIQGTLFSGEVLPLCWDLSGGNVAVNDVALSVTPRNFGRIVTVTPARYANSGISRSQIATTNRFCAQYRVPNVRSSRVIDLKLINRRTRQTVHKLTLQVNQWPPGY